MDFEFILLLIAVLILITIGTLGMTQPEMPDLPLIWLGVFLFAAATNWKVIDLGITMFLTMGMLVVLLLEIITLHRNYRPQRHQNNHIICIVSASLGGLIGGLISLPIGLFLGVLWGALLSELAMTPDRIFLYDTKMYRVVGFVGTTLLKITVAVFMIGIFFQKLFTLTP